MKLLFDLLPIFIFFVAYKFSDIYIATAVAIAAVTGQMAALWFRGKKPDLMNVITFVMVLVLGGATLLFRNELFIKWKPTAVYGVLGLVFAASHFFKKPLAQKLLEKNLELPAKSWSQLNISWWCFFFIMGIVNLVVVYTCDTNTWVNFKLFGTLILTFVFVVLQGIWVSRLMPQPATKQSNHIQ